MKSLFTNACILFLCKYNVIYELQFGFRSKHSTNHALISLTEMVRKAMDDGKFACGVFIDLQKAFDTVDHDILLEKLKCYGLSSDCLEWFLSYLASRHQRCSANGTLSTARFLTHGVPQGTILGPVLFLIYINDLPNCLDYSTPRLYADDTTLTFSDCDMAMLQHQMKIDLQQIEKWLRANKLTLNVLKSEYMLVGSRQKLSTLDQNSMSLSVDGLPLKRCNEAKCLGVLIDEHLTWKKHIQSITSKVSIGLRTLKSIKPILNRDCMIKVYKTTIEPYFDYCSLVWDSIDAALTNKLQVLQNRAARIITGASYLTVRTSDIFEQLNWEKLNERRMRQKAIMMFKIVNGMAPPYLVDMFSRKHSNKAYHMRGSNQDLQLPKANTNYYRNSFAFTGTEVWNSLPIELKEQKSLNSFINKLEHHQFRR